jgi:hypothetical protein
MQFRHSWYGGLALAAVMATGGCAKGTGTAEVAPAVAPSLEAAAVYERMVEAVGGREALEQYTSTHALGEFSLPAQGIQGNLEIFTAAPHFFLVEVDIPGVGTVRSGYNGEVGWTINPATGPMIMEGNQLNQMRQQADFAGPLNIEAYVDSASVVEEAEFGGKMCQKVRLVTNWGEEYFEFYDVETGLQVGTIRTQESPMGAIEATTVVSDYQHFGGILAPTRTVQSMMGMEQIISVTTVEYDTVDPAVFELPDDIKAMLN